MSKYLAIQHLKIQFGNLISFIRLSNNEGKFDINKECEKIIAKVLSIHKKANYLVLEKEKKNFPAIDVSSADFKIGFQVTSETTSNKIKDTCLKIFEHGINETFSSIGIIFLSDTYKASVTDNAIAKYLKKNLNERKYNKYVSSNFSITNITFNLSNFIQFISDENTTEEIIKISDIIQDEIGSIGLSVKNNILIETPTDKSIYIFPNKIITKREQVEDLINESLKSSERTKDYYETIDLINTFQNSYSSVLSKEKNSELALKKAILFQKTGDTIKASKSLLLFENANPNFENSLEYFLCKGKIISQSNKDPKVLEEFVEEIETKDLFNIPSNRHSLASFYWRLNILFSCEDNKKSKNYFSKHRELSEVGSYQFAHNIQCEAITNIKMIRSDNKINNQLLSTIPELLAESYKKYNELNNFTYLDKCLVSNLLLMATFDRMSKQILSYYRKTFFVRKIFKKMHIKPNDEAMAEILSIIKNLFPDMYNLVFLNSISSLINTGKKNSIIKEIYLEVELEFERIFKIDYNSFVINIYKSLVF